MINLTCDNYEENIKDLPIIGICGKIGSGKTTLANYTNRIIEKSIIIDYSDPMKDIIHLMFGLDREMLNGDNGYREERETRIEQYGYSPRELLQKLGDFGREIDPNIWNQCLFNMVDKIQKVTIIIPGIRYPDEIKHIHNRNGKVIHLQGRKNKLFKSNHVSELSVDNCKDYCDYYILEESYEGFQNKYGIK